MLEELARAGVHFGSQVHTTVAHYILAYGTEEQKRRWLPRMGRGELVGAIAMTEPGAGSDLQAIKTLARRDGDDYVDQRLQDLHHQRHARRARVRRGADRTRTVGMRAISLIVVETDGLAGYRAGRPLEKVGMKTQDTCELFFDDGARAAANLLGGARARLRAVDGAAALRAAADRRRRGGHGRAGASRSPPAT